MHSAALSKQHLTAGTCDGGIFTFEKTTGHFLRTGRETALELSSNTPGITKECVLLCLGKGTEWIEIFKIISNISSSKALTVRPSLSTTTASDVSPWTETLRAAGTTWPRETEPTTSRRSASGASWTSAGTRPGPSRGFSTGNWRVLMTRLWSRYPTGEIARSFVLRRPGRTMKCQSER